MAIKKSRIFTLFFSLLCGYNFAQQHKDPAYIKVTQKRASKIVEKLALSNPEEESLLIDIIAEQYRNLSQIHDKRDAKIGLIKLKKLSKTKQDQHIGRVTSKATKAINKLHKTYIHKLEIHLSPEKVDAVKDGMTYWVVPKTYQAFLEMLLQLTEEQKKFIYVNLVEAREQAMDAGSSKEKHAWFGKYKGRINNYLSAQGYDLNKESKDWHERIKKANKTKSQHETNKQP